MNNKKICCLNCKEYKKFQGKGLCKKCYMIEYYQKNREKLIEYSKKRQEKNKKERKEYCKKYYLNNKKKLNRLQEEWRENNPGYIKKWRENNSEKAKEITRMDNFQRRVNGQIKKGTINKIISENIFKYGIITCEKCKKDCEDNFHIDHIIPISKKGDNDYDNLQVLCAHCNLSKHIEIVNYKQDIENNQLFLRGV